MRVGVIGLGAMGGAFARNLVADGWTVRGFDLDPARRAALHEAGGEPVGTPAEAARDSERVVLSLPDHEVVRRVILGPEGAVHGSAPGCIFVDTSTSPPEASRALARDLAERGVAFLDACVSGTGATARERDVVALVGGDATSFAACAELFRAIARNAYHLGPTGAGALGKLVINVAVVGNRLALAEALNFGTAVGMDPATVLEILKDGTTYSRAMDLKGDKMVQRDYRPESTLAASLHGTHLLLDEAERAGAPLFLVSLYAQMARIAVGLGYGPSDPAALVEALRHLTAPDRHD